MMSAMTEEEARGKWCPYARQQSTMGRNSFNRRGSAVKVLAGCRCIASECMAWRWGTEIVTEGDWEQTSEVKSTTHGYCGLAGSP